MSEQAEIGVVGGSGFYSFLDDVTEVTVDTPYGDPSDSLFFGELAGRRVAFLPRHGRKHHLPPHRINYRANMWALRSVGVRQVLGPARWAACSRSTDRARCWCRTSWWTARSRACRPTSTVSRCRRVRAHVVHLTFADPYCETGRQAALGPPATTEWEAVDGGTMCVVEGPRFSTRAESSGTRRRAGPWSA